MWKKQFQAKFQGQEKDQLSNYSKYFFWVSSDFTPSIPRDTMPLSSLSVQVSIQSYLHLS